MTSIKGPGAPQTFDGTGLRIGIVHARWNMQIIGPLVEGAKKSLLAAGVAEDHITVHTVPGSYELPYAVQRSALFLDADLSKAPSSPPSSAAKPFDALIAIGVLIKGETMHFEYIADAVTHGLMRIQLDSGVPVIFGVLTVLTEEQGLERAGQGTKMHNHGEDWGSAAVELGCKRRDWAGGVVV
ncbi:6,7-dimethyl-8-ribityllumazine synthase [Aspergillus rambellii]|uniref:6,7-dimethyl-8-ribityllumazine synthase n=1 Tax=Aspergillus rambellii TaxID=308745 RepID=A0A0F8WLT6_9EURO|nr:6,7-dimethyl-8-ribityllumazine synthase [Aspergillus rambellii]